ncbi:IS110 family transposase [bacterium]|nr:IS110 family transposase [bacterium]
MKYHKIDSRYSCGIDLHAKSMYVCVMDRQGQIHYHRNMRNDFNVFKDSVQPFLPDLTVGCEASGYYYWLADGCKKHEIPFCLGHTLYMRAITGKKKKNDKLDSQVITDLMRANMLPYAFTYPKAWRSTRDLLRRRHRLVHLRAEAYTHVQAIFKQQGIMDSLYKFVKKKHERRTLIDRFDEHDLQLIIQSDLDVMDSLDPIIAKIEKKIIKSATHHDRRNFNMLTAVPGIGNIIALTLLYEIFNIRRFPSVQQFSSYCGLVKCERESAGKNTGGGKGKIRNAYLKNAFTSIILSAPIGWPGLKKYYDRLQSKHGKRKAKGIIAHKFAVAVYFMLKNGEDFDMDRFISTSR